MSAKRILLTGASGYLGQHLLHALIQGDESCHITALYNSEPEFADATEKLDKATTVEVEQLDLADERAAAWVGSKPFFYDVCIHTAAMSSPAACEKEPIKAAAVNNPTHFFDALLDSNKFMTLIVLSTDQVYDGTKPPYKETDPANPCNVYGKSKKEMEDFLLTKSKDHLGIVILRSSIILGPKAPLLPEVAHATFLHFIAGRQNQETSFFTDERRSVVSVRDVVGVILWMIENNAKEAIYNMGGPESVSRHDMAVAVFQHFNYDTKYIKAAKKAEQPAGSVHSPLDISMDSSPLYQLTGRSFLSLQEIVKDTFAAART